MRTFSHPGSVTALAYTPDGTTLFSADTGETVRAWDIATGSCVVVHQNAVEVPWAIRTLAVSPNGKLLLVGCLVCRIGPFPAPNRPVVFHDHHPNTRRIRLASGWTALMLDGGPGAAFSPNSRLIAGGSGWGSIRVWRIADGQRMNYLQSSAEFSRPVFSPDGKTLTAVFTERARETSLISWNARTFAIRLTETVHYDAIHADAIPLYSPDGRWLVVASGNKIHLHDPRSRLLAWQGALEDEAVEHIRTIAFSSSSQHLLTGGIDQRGAPIVSLWAISAGGPVAQWDWQIGTVNQVAIAPDGMTAAAAGSDGLMVVWDLDP